MDESICRRLNTKLNERQIAPKVNTTELCAPCGTVVLNGEVNRDNLYTPDNLYIPNDIITLQDPVLPDPINPSLLHYIVLDTGKLALFMLFGISLYALYIISKNNLRNNK